MRESTHYECLCANGRWGEIERERERDKIYSFYYDEALPLITLIDLD
jgi:hypothetical protein